MSFCEFISKPESWLTIVTAGTAIIAIWQTRRQISLSNKHLLFDRRLEKYTIINELLSNIKYFNYHFTKEIYKVDKEAFLRSTLYSLFDCSMLREVRWAFNEPYKIESSDAIMLQTDSLLRLSEEIPILFNSKESKKVSAFVDEYVKLILKLSILFFNRSASNHNDEKLESMEHIDKSYEAVKCAYETVIDNKAMEKLIKEIKL